MNVDRLLAHSGFLRALARGLLGDDARVDDVLQDTWMSALRRPPRKPDSLRSWLGKVTVNAAKKVVRSDVRRDTREREAPTPRASLTPAEILDREAGIRRMVDAVFRLPEPYRAVVLMRYYDDMSPSEIARLEDLPVETVRTRLKRALTRLRGLLETSDGKKGGSWRNVVLLVLGVPVGRASAAASVATTAATGVGVGVKAAAGLLAVIATGFVLSGLGSSGDVDDPDGPLLRASRRSVTPTVLAAAGKDGPAPVVEESEPAEEIAARAETGELVVLARWSDGSPAARVHARVISSPTRRREIPILDAIEAMTLDDGKLLLRDLAPGSYKVTFDRGASVRLPVTAGERVEHELVFRDGVDVEGIVTGPDGEAVAGASVWLSYPREMSGEIVATSGSDGRFFVRAASRASHLGVRKEGFVPSRIRPVPDRTPECDLEFALRAGGGEVVGTVFSEEGEPLVGAGVIVLKRAFANVSRDASGARTGEPEQFRTRSDERGEFMIAGLAEGQWSVEVGASGLAPWQETVSVKPGERVHVGALLGPGATVEGKVETEDGGDARWVRLDARTPRRFLSEWNRLLAANTDEEGRFRMGPVPTGTLDLTAFSRSEGTARVTVRLVKGEALAWNPTLSRGRSLLGRVIGSAGEPLVGWGLELREERNGFPRLVGRGRTDEEGRFRFANLEGPDYQLAVFEVVSRGTRSVPALEVRDLVPGPDEREIHVDASGRASVWLTGAVEIPDGESGEGVFVSLWERSFHRESFALGTEDTFRVGPFRPGLYRVRVQGPSLGVLDLGRRRFEPGQVVDLGSIAFRPPGSVRVGLKRFDGQPIDLSTISIVDGTLRVVSALEAKGERAVSTEPLAPGEYSLSPRTAGVDQTLIPFVVREGEQTRLDAVLETALFRRIHVIHDGTGDETDRLRSRVYDDRGELVFGRTLRFQGSSPGSHFVYLRAGFYTIVLETDSGLRGDQGFELRPGAGVEPVSVALR